MWLSMDELIEKIELLTAGFILGVVCACLLFGRVLNEKPVVMEYRPRYVRQAEQVAARAMRRR